MYTEFFGLTEKPFSITPDPRYLYLSERHAEALAHLLYGVTESGGFIQLTGEVVDGGQLDRLILSRFGCLGRFHRSLLLRVRTGYLSPK